MVYRGPSPMESYPNPPEMGGLRVNFPLIYPVNRQMAGEMLIDWYGPDGLGIVNFIQPLNDYNGNVWSIQLTARPGYYVSPEIMYELGWSDDEVPPNA